MSKKRVALSMVRNESDVIETFIRHNLTLLDELHIVDHNSSDNTREILTLLKQEGLPIHIYHYNELEFAPERVLNHMMQHILNNDADIDYIFPLDADEFIYCPSREKLNAFLTLIPQNRVGMYIWRGYLPSSTEYDPDFICHFTDQRKEEILTPKVIIPRAIAETCILTIGSHYMIDSDGKEIKSTVFIEPNNQQFYYWFIERFQAEFITTNDLWLGHYPIRSTIQQIKKVLEKSITMVMEKKGYRDSAWENQLRDLLTHNLDISLDELRLIAYNYRASDEKQIQIACQQPLRSTKLALKYQYLINNDPLPVLAKLILDLAEKLR
ncbi:MAG: glycosyltransferase family 2 protein [Haemophilus parainfluenzae]